MWEKKQQCINCRAFRDGTVHMVTDLKYACRAIAYFKLFVRIKFRDDSG